MELQELLSELTGTNELREQVGALSTKLDSVMDILCAIRDENATPVATVAPTVIDAFDPVGDVPGETNFVRGYSRSELPPGAYKFTEMKVTPVKPNAKGNHFGLRAMMVGKYRNGTIRNQVYLGYFVGTFAEAQSETSRLVSFFHDNPSAVASILTVSKKDSPTMGSRMARTFLDEANMR